MNLTLFSCCSPEKVHSDPGFVDEYPNLAAYVARGEARPAFKRAFDAQLAVFVANTPAE